MAEPKLGVNAVEQLRAAAAKAAAVRQAAKDAAQQLYQERQPVPPVPGVKR
jgi:hypothetical protein